MAPYAQRITELKEKRRRLVEVDARGIHEAALKEKRDLTSEEEANWSRALDDADKIQKQVEQLERQERAELTLAIAQRTTEPDDPEQRADPEPGKVLEFSFRDVKNLQRREALREFYGDESRSHLLKPGYAAAFRQFVALNESRAHQADLDISGGYLKAPPQFVAGLLQAVDDQLWMRQLATIIPVTSSDTLGAVSLDSDPDDADWTAEIKAAAETADMKFGKRELKPHPLSKLAKLSRKLIRVSALSPESILIQRLAHKMALPQEKGFLNGTGAGQPLGIFTASPQGIPTSRDVASGNTTTAIKFDGLKEAKYTLKAQYWAKAAWLFHRDGIKQLAKEKDGEGRYVWEAAVRAGEPDRLLQFPFYASEFAPNTFTTGKYVGMLGDYSFYWIAEGLALEIQRLVEKYAETNQVGFIARAEVDGMPVLAEPFVRVKLA